MALSASTLFKRFATTRVKTLYLILMNLRPSLALRLWLNFLSPKSLSLLPKLTIIVSLSSLKWIKVGSIIRQIFFVGAKSEVNCKLIYLCDMLTKKNTQTANLSVLGSACKPMKTNTIIILACHANISNTFARLHV